VAGKGMPVPNMRLPMACYVVGLIACGLAFFFGYLTQFRLYNESMGWSPQRQHVKHQIAGIIFALLSLVSVAGEGLDVDHLSGDARDEGGCLTVLDPPDPEE
jgi:hypothetical protein